MWLLFWTLGTHTTAAHEGPPGWMTFEQPDGTPFEARYVSDGLGVHLEDRDGYAVVGHDGADGTWWFWAREHVGGLEATPSLATEPVPANAALSVEASSVELPGDPYDAGFAAMEAIRQGGSLLAEGRLTRPLVVLVRFPSGHPTGMPRAGHTREQFASLLFDADLDPARTGLPTSYTSSMADYWFEVSNGQFVMDGGVSDVIGWVTAPQPYDWYVNGDQGADFSSGQSSLTLAEDVLGIVSRDQDLGQWDTDGDGWVDEVIFVIEGWFSGSNDQFWAYRVTTGAPLEFDGVSVGGFVIAPERWYSSGEESLGIRRGDIHPIGVFCHEYGHSMRLPDLYDTEPGASSSGVGEWSLMGSGNWNTPNHPAWMDPWSRQQVGWLDPIDVTDGGGASRLDPTETGGDVLRVWMDEFREREHLLIENRQRLGSDVGLRGPGLLIWHVDGDRTNRLGNSVNHRSLGYGVALEQADGASDLELGRDRGDAGDPFPGATGNRTFSHTTVPSSARNDGSNSGISITRVAAEGLDVTFDLQAPEPRGKTYAHDRLTEASGVGSADASTLHGAVRFDVDTDGAIRAVRVWGPPESLGVRTVSVREASGGQPGVTRFSRSVSLVSGWNRVPVEPPVEIREGSSWYAVLSGPANAYPLPIDRVTVPRGQSSFAYDAGAFTTLPNGNLNLRLVVEECPDLDGDGHRSCDGDCDDHDDAVFPGAETVCDGVDNDCDGVVDARFPNADGDAFADCGDPDDDNDTVADGSDPDPRNPARCGDRDHDTCDDCSVRVGTPTRSNDGPDLDADGLCDAGDSDSDGDGVDNELDVAPADRARCLDADQDACDDCSVTRGPPDLAHDGPDLDGDRRCDLSDADDDGDGLADLNDLAPRDPSRCGDVDVDGCDDCSAGAGPHLVNDGADVDGDGLCDDGDVDDDGDGVPDGSDPDAFASNRCGDVDDDGCDDCGLTHGPADSAHDGSDADADGRCDLTDTDDDGDTVLDADDVAPGDPGRCADADRDGCDDCTSSPADPSNDGPDADGDGLCDTGDDTQVAVGCSHLPAPHSFSLLIVGLGLVARRASRSQSPAPSSSITCGA